MGGPSKLAHINQLHNITYEHLVIWTCLALYVVLKTLTAGTPHHVPVHFNVNIHFVLLVLFLHLYHCGT